MSVVILIYRTTDKVSIPFIPSLDFSTEFSVAVLHRLRFRLKVMYVRDINKNGDVG